MSDQSKPLVDRETFEKYVQYTPTTDNIRTLFSARTGDADPFDRWLAAHDAEVRAEASREPSEAQVEIAWRTWLGLEADEAVMGHWIHEARVQARAALRAAALVK